MQRNIIERRKEMAKQKRAHHRMADGLRAVHKSGIKVFAGRAGAVRGIGLTIEHTCTIHVVGIICCYYSVVWSGRETD